MQAYMKSAMPKKGIAAPLRRRLSAEVAQAHPCADIQSLMQTAQRLWDGASHREQRYVALALPREKPHRPWQGDIACLPLYEHMIVSGAWWDFCDDISGAGLGALLKAQPAVMKPVLRRWAKGPTMWLRRAAMLAQRQLKTGFDAVLFYDCILPSLQGAAPASISHDFFIRKGMGWALRERSYAAPDEVLAFVAANAGGLSPLTQREALRVVHKRRGVTSDT
jgi:3-methyladenine DNA glycosylase AlkD